jgi:hypothetical protein
VLCRYSCLHATRLGQTAAGECRCRRLLALNTTKKRITGITAMVADPAVPQW